MKGTVWSKIAATLEDDERMIWPDMYFENRKMYDMICGTVYLVRDKHGEIDWIQEGHVDEYLREHDRILAEMLIVRLRLPWNKLHYEWLIDQEELFSHHEDFEVIEVFLRVREKETGYQYVMVDPLEYEMYPDKYDVLETRYLVAWRYDEGLKKCSYGRGIDPDSVTTKPQY
jgi:hypothetical protein